MTNSDEAAASHPDLPLSETKEVRNGRHPPIGSGCGSGSGVARPTDAAASQLSPSTPHLGVDDAPIDTAMAMSDDDWREAAMDEMFGPAITTATAADGATRPLPATDAGVAAATVPPPVSCDNNAAGAARSPGGSAAPKSIMSPAPPDEWWQVARTLRANIATTVAAKSPTPAGVPSSCSWTTRMNKGDYDGGWGYLPSSEAEVKADSAGAPAAPGVNHPLDVPYPLWVHPASMWQPPPPPVATGAGGPAHMGVLLPFNEEAPRVAACVTKPLGMDEMEYLEHILDF